MRQMIGRGRVRAHDPAPSRFAYRMQRLALTPMVRRSFTVGVPVAAATLMVSLWALDVDRRAAVQEWATDLARDIQSREEFMVKLMAIDGASEMVAGDIREMLPLNFPISSFDLDLIEMQTRIQSLDAVKTASLRVKPGGILEIAVDERVPDLVWRTPDGLRLIDVDGQRVAEIATRAERADLPLISGRGADLAAAEALDLVEAAAPLTSRLRGLVRIGERRWDMVLSDGQKIRLPETGAVAALEQVLAVDEAQELFARDVVLVDMRQPRRPTVRLSPDASRDLREVKLIELGDD